MKNIDKTDSEVKKDQTSIDNTPRFDVSYFPSTTKPEKTLNAIFSEQNYENKTVQSAKEILGSDYETKDIQELIASFEYLIQNWLEEYEKKMFNNKTLKDLLQAI